MESDRRRAELRQAYALLPELLVDELERKAMTETDVVARSGALALVVHIRRRRRKALEPLKP